MWSADVVPAYVTVAAMIMTFQTSRLCHGHGRDVLTVTVTVTDNLLKHKKSMFSSLAPGVSLLGSEPQLHAVRTPPLW